MDLEKLSLLFGIFFYSYMICNDFLLESISLFKNYNTST